jgi:hypothetical protein
MPTTIRSNGFDVGLYSHFELPVSEPSFGTYASGHNNDNRSIPLSDKPPAQRTSQLMASLGGTPNDEQIGVTGVRNTHELSGCVPVGTNEGDVDSMVVAVRAHLSAEFFCLVGHRLLHGPVGNGCSGK